MDDATIREIWRAFYAEDVCLQFSSRRELEKATKAFWKNPELMGGKRRPFAALKNTLVIARAWLEPLKRAGIRFSLIRMESPGLSDREFDRICRELGIRRSRPQ
jgi:hypothetical protein